MDTAARRDRLLSLLHRGPTTVPAIARELDVSERTAYRDIAALRTAGHGIDATPGPGGGVRITPDSRPRPVHFEVSEIVGLALSVAILRATRHVPFAQSAEAALDRSRRALSADRQRNLQRLLRRILVGSPANEHIRASLGDVDPGLLPVFERCFTDGRSMTFDYVDRFGAPTSRRIECVALVLHAPAWYVVAWDLDKDAPRMFRMDRISDPTAGPPLAERHPFSFVAEQACPGAEATMEPWIGTPLA